MKKSIKNELYRIAAFNSYTIENRGDLEEHEREEDNKLELSVADIHAMLMQAYELGKKVAEAEKKQAEDFKSQIFRNACKAYNIAHPATR